MKFVDNLMGCCISSLGIVLFIAFITNKFLRNRSTIFNYFVDNFSWAFGSITALLSLIFFPQNQIKAISWAIGGTMMSLLFFFFIQETKWAAKTIFSKKSKS